jgi:predicted transcriptional regulator
MAKVDLSLKTNERKWGKPLMQAGWTCLPNVIIEHQLTLKLQPLDVNILLHLAFRWWEAENKPHPAKASMAKAMGVHPTTIQRRIRELEKRGLIKREYRDSPERGNLTNKYHFTGLITVATAMAKDILRDREKHKRERDAKTRRGGRPGLSTSARPTESSAEAT